MAVHSGPKGDYFRLPGTMWLILVPLGIGLLTMAYLCPQYVPYGYLGPLGRLTHHLVTDKPTILAGIFYMMWILHGFEAYYALQMAREKNLREDVAQKWSKFTFIFGIFCLKHLIAYEPKVKDA